MKRSHVKGAATFAALSLVAGCAAFRGEDDESRYGRGRGGQEFRADVAPTTRMQDRGRTYSSYDERSTYRASSSGHVVPGPTSVIPSSSTTPDWVRANQGTATTDTSGTTGSGFGTGTTGGARDTGTTSGTGFGNGTTGTAGNGRGTGTTENGVRGDGRGTGSGTGLGAGVGTTQSGGPQRGTAGAGAQPGTRTDTTVGAGTNSTKSGAVASTIAPDFSLRDTNGQEHRLSEHTGKVVVLEWTNPACPFVKRHYGSGAMQALQKRYTGQGVVWLAVNSAQEGSEGFLTNDAWNTSIRDNGTAATAVLLDPKGEVGRLFGARTTPHVFVVAQDGRIAYQGAVDDKATSESDEAQGARNYLTEALDALLAGKPVPLSETTPYGCPVKFTNDAGTTPTPDATNDE